MIKNISKKTILTQNFKEELGFGKIKGLMLSKNPHPIMLKTRFGIHTFFLKFAIDVLVLNKNGKVVFLKKSVKPNNVVFWNPVFNTVLELAEGTIAKSKTEVNDILKLSL